METFKPELSSVPGGVVGGVLGGGGFFKSSACLQVGHTGFHRAQVSMHFL